jgi:hypothetical protein
MKLNIFGELKLQTSLEDTADERENFLSSIPKN